MSISEEAWLCKFVPSNDELVCVAGRADSSTFLWISLVDIWSMSMLQVCRLEISGLGLQNDVEEDPFFGVMVSRLQDGVAFPGSAPALPDITPTGYRAWVTQARCNSLPTTEKAN
ncbi:hypothetical protein FOZ63_029801 [Perkinsus olseni]|uniref:Uncharacterized protein n=1 Tax=Perkinsus olseni TaxID=32597 RepID=A0A7J6RC28_PEROL|nr:hypothetical protein FOZ63_029801 [Perkinsus olseni]